MRPGKLRRVAVLPHAVREAKEILNDGQYFHVVGIVKRLVHFGDHRELWDLRIEAIDSFFELKLKGGLLGNINLRVYFADLAANNEIVVLKTYKKEEDHKTPRRIVVTLEDRLSDYCERRVGRQGVIVYQPTLITNEGSAN